MACNVRLIYLNHWILDGSQEMILFVVKVSILGSHTTPIAMYIWDDAYSF